MTTPPTIPKAPAASTPPPAKFDVLKESSLLTREQFDALGHAKQAEFIRNGGSLVREVKHGNANDVAAESIVRMQDPDDVAVALLKGFGLSMADATPHMIAWGASHHDKSFRAYDDARCKEALAKAEKSSRPVGYLLPGAAPVNDEARISRRKSEPFKQPGEVAEPERRAAEDKLVAMLTEFEAINNEELRRIWWERNHETVEDHAKNETKRSRNWIAFFVTRITGINTHITR